ncbi:MAG: YaiO family outer membrane beta-barrel protein, partial [Ginsengibacter sp.]
MKSLIILFLTFLNFSVVFAQHELSSDELFSNARQAAFREKDYDMAKQLAWQALRKSPAYTDIEIFLGRVYTWDKQYDSARYHFANVLHNDGANEDASSGYADLEYWNKHYQNSLEICNTGLKLFPASEELLIRKAKNLKALEKYTEAMQVTEQILIVNKNNKEALSLAKSIKDATASNRVTVGYEYSAFDKQFDKAWHLGSIAYGRNTKLGSFIARVNYASRFGSSGWQAEADAYPRISNTFYTYVNFGYSADAGIFPQYRAGFSLYANLPKSFEAEAGMRYLYFSSPTTIYTFSLGKYYKSFLFSARTYLTPSAGTLSQSYSLNGRYYFGGEDDYISLTAGTGISPDDNTQNVLLNNKQLKLSSKKAS